MFTTQCSCSLQSIGHWQIFLTNGLKFWKSLGQFILERMRNCCYCYCKSGKTGKMSWPFLGASKNTDVIAQLLLPLDMNMVITACGKVVCQGSLESEPVPGITRTNLVSHSACLILTSVWHICPFNIGNSCHYDIKLIPICTSGKDVVILTTDTLSIGSVTVVPINLV